VVLQSYDYYSDPYYGYSNYDDSYYGYNNYDDSYYYEEEQTEIERVVEKAVEKVTDAVISYGFDVEVVQSWFENKGASWEELTRAHDEEKAAAFKADVAEANEYLKVILDNMVADIYARQEVASADLEANLDEYAEMFKTEATA
jgi:hypothetical protein